MSTSTDPRVGTWRDYADPEPSPHVKVIEIATQRRPSGSISIAVLTRPGSPPLVSLQHFNSAGSSGARSVFRVDELDDLESAIALARRSV